MSDERTEVVDRSEAVLGEILGHLDLDSPLIRECFTENANIVVAAREAGIRANPYMAETVNLARGVERSMTSYHAFAVVGDTIPFLVDPTFKKFVIPSANVVTVVPDIDRLLSAVSSNNPVIQRLLEKKYLLLTDTNLNTYLDALTSASAAATKPLRSATLLDNSLAYRISPAEHKSTVRELKKYYNFDPRVLKK